MARKNRPFKTQDGHHASDRVPVEIWREIACWLSRSQHKALMRVPHVLGRLSSELFYRNIVLYYGTLPVSMLAWRDPSRHPVNHQLDRWHVNRCNWIISRILEVPEFAQRVRTLKVYASGPLDIISPQMVSLSGALPRLKKLETFSCYGSCMSPLANMVTNLHETVPQLRGLIVKYATDGNFDLPTTPRNLESFSFDPAITRPDLSIYPNFLEQDLSCLRKLRFPNHNHTLPIITSLMGRLTHLDLYDAPSYWYGTTPFDPSPFEVVLREGVRLESLRIQRPRPSQTPSIHFRRYSHSLPHLKQFSISFGSPTPPEIDRDLFPAICDFLRNKPGLVTLELAAPRNLTGHKLLGYDRRCWDLLHVFDRLRGLSITLTELGDSEHCLQLIPRSVTTLTLTGDVHFHKVISGDSQVHWPKHLRFLSLEQPASGRTASKIATYVPSIYVVHLNGSHYNVVSLAAGKPAQVKRWTERTEDYFWSEELEARGCEDRLLYMFPPAIRYY